MAVLTLNGITVPAALDEVSRLAPELIGEEGRAFSGAELANVRAYKEGWRARLTPQAAATGAAFRALAQGQGYNWPLNSDLYSGKGLGAASGAGIHVSGKHGNCLSTNQTITFAVGAGSAWTILGWVFKPSNGFWEHYIRLSAGTKYLNGVATGADPLMNVSGANLTLTPEVSNSGAAAWAPATVYTAGNKVLESGVVFVMESAATSGTNTVEPTWSTALFAEVEEDPGGGEGGPWTWRGSNTGFDDVMFLPYVIPAAWASQLYTEANARAWTALPRLRLAGDAAAGLASGFATVTGKVSGDAKLVRGNLGGTLARNADPLELELREA